jgi:hypothetical protein
MPQVINTIESTTSGFSRRLAPGATAVFCRIRGVWLIDGSPARDFYRRDVVGQSREIADHTLEHRLGRTVAFIDMATRGVRAGARRIAGVNMDHLHACAARLVADFVFQVIERPAMQGGSLRLSNRYPVADAVEVFQGDAALSALRLSHNALADTVVGIFGKTALLARQLAEQAPCRLRAFLLQLTAQTPMAVADVVDVAPLVDLPIVVYRKVDDATINPQKLVNFFRGWFVDLAGCQQVKRPIVEPQVALPFLVLEQFALPHTTLIGDLDPPT